MKLNSYSWTLFIIIIISKRTGLTGNRVLVEPETWTPPAIVPDTGILRRIMLDAEDVGNESPEGVTPGREFASRVVAFDFDKDEGGESITFKKK